ncbi:MAG TPA: hypothetical protein VFW88_06855 [Burkholderiales bacterium]|nr:hypothetical protein [Burkholderiales bacterium]
MTTAKDCFADNIRRLDPRVEPIQYNLNQGLHLLSEQVDRLRREQADMAAQMQSLLKASRRP